MAPINSSERARRTAVSILVVGPLIVAATLIKFVGPFFKPTNSLFASGDEASVVMLDNGATALIADKKVQSFRANAPNGRRRDQPILAAAVAPSSQ